jgi:DNA-binding CsgD family transcriptional regulator
LVERDAERQMIDSALDGAELGHGRVVLVYGQAGAGRTSILRAAALDAEARGLTVLEAGGSELERGYGFGVVRQLLEARMAELTPAQARSLLREAGPAAESALGIGPPDSRTAGAGFDQIEGVHRLVTRLAAIAPVLVVVDDMQWCDRPSLDVVCFLGHRVTQLPVTIVAAWRRGEPGVKAGRLQALAGKPDTFFLAPEPLSHTGVRAILRRETQTEPEDAAVAAVHEQTGGQPSLVAELVAGLRLRDLPATSTSREAIETLTPESVRRMAVARLGRHSEPVQRFAEAVAVLGEAPLVHAAALAGVDQDRACAAAAALVRAGILRDDATIRYAQPLLSRAVYDTLSSIERAGLHRRAAELLCDCEHPEMERAASHLLLSEPAGNPRFGEVLHAAALRALDLGMRADARQFLERALGEVEEPGRRATLLTRLAELELLAGDVQDAAAHGSEAMSLVCGSRERVLASLVCAQALGAAGSLEPAVDLLDHEAAALNGDHRELRLRLQAAAAALQVCTGAPLTAATNGTEKLPGRSPAERALLGAWASEATLRGAATADRVADACRRGLREDVDYLAAQAAMAADADELVGHALDRSSPGGDDTVVRLAVRAQQALARGDLRASEADGRAALAKLEGVGLTTLHRRIRSDLLAGLASVALERGRYDEAEQLISEVDAPAADCLRVALALARSEPASGLAVELEQAPAGIIAPGICWRPLAALAHHAANDGGRAVALASDQLEHAEAWGGATQLGRALLVRGIVDPGTERLRFVQAAVEVLENSSAELEIARATVELGTALRRARRRRDARQQLERGADLAHRCGADALAARARAELVSVGARPRRAAFSGISSLTASELRVARLAASGMTNREVAQELIVSVKTVSAQLMAIYRKLDVHDRAALAEAMRAENGQIA